MAQQADVEVELVTAKWTAERNFLFTTQRGKAIRWTKGLIISNALSVRITASLAH